MLWIGCCQKMNRCQSIKCYAWNKVLYIKHPDMQIQVVQLACLINHLNKKNYTQHISQNHFVFFADMLLRLEKTISDLRLMKELRFGRI